MNNLIYRGRPPSQLISNANPEYADKNEFNQAMQEVGSRFNALTKDNDQKFEKFYTVFGILFAVFAIGGFAGSQYSPLELYSLWLLALFAVSFYTLITFARTLIADSERKTVANILLISVLLVFTLIMGPLSFWSLGQAKDKIEEKIEERFDLFAEKKDEIIDGQNVKIDLLEESIQRLQDQLIDLSQSRNIRYAR